MEILISATQAALALFSAILDFIFFLADFILDFIFFIFFIAPMVLFSAILPLAFFIFFIAPMVLFSAILPLTFFIFFIAPMVLFSAILQFTYFIFFIAPMALFSAIPQFTFSIFFMAPILVAAAATYLLRHRRLLASTHHHHHSRADDDPYAPVSVNYFPSRECNYACGFCFHTNTSGYILPLGEAKRGLRLLRDAGMRKLNIAGGEPFLHPAFLGELLRYCKDELGLESVSIISNGSKIREGFLREYGRYLDILAISCDSFVQETNKAIGRGENGQGDGGHVAQVFRIAEWCREYGIMFKLNTVVNTFNWDEDMAGQIAQLAPFRWKVFQCLIVEGENENETRVRDARRFLISQEQWETFCDRHKHLPCYVPEDNQTMAGSYLLLDERMRFLDKGDGPMKKSDSLLDVGVKKAMEQVAWDKEAFDKRGGIYEWRKPQTAGSVDGGCDGEDKKELDW